MKKIILWLLSIVIALLLAFLYKEYKLPSTGGSVVYLKPLFGGEFSDNELKEHPEVVVVHSVRQLKHVSDNQILPIWIDKAYFDRVDAKWIDLKLHQYYPVIVIGYGNADYPFRNIPIGRHLPPLDIKKYEEHLNEIKKETGISVCKKKFDDNMGNWSSYCKGFDGNPQIDDVLRISENLLSNSFNNIIMQ